METRKRLAFLPAFFIYYLYRMTFKEEISQLKAYRTTRENLAKQVLEQPSLYPELFNLAMDTSWPDHFKACWVLDLVLEERMSLLDQDKTRFCRTLPNFTQEGALRSISRIVWNAVKNQKSTKGLQFSYLQKEELATVCFDWLVSEVKVASKANAIYTLYELGLEL
ncbi:MAG: hypothetical protein EOO01_35235, partial [Chitinophagaceae bacterium]